MLNKLPVPKLSELLNPLAQIESNIRTQIESATGMPLPVGVAEMTKNVLESIESSAEGIFGSLTTGYEQTASVQTIESYIPELSSSNVENPSEKEEARVEERSEQKKELSFEV